MVSLTINNIRKIKKMEENKDIKFLAENSIIKKYRKYIWSKFIKACKDYRLIEEGDKVAVAISGGKDSLLLAKLIEELQKHGLYSFEVVYIAMDPGYSEKNREKLLKNADQLGIDLKIFKTNIFEISEGISKNAPCYMCARMRRGALYSKAKELGANKLALGHHFDDVIETTMINILRAGSYKTMMPKLKSKNFEGIELIRPMYYIREKSIISWRDHIGLKAMNCACSFTERKEDGTRKEIKKLIEGLEEKFPNVENSIFKSSENVNIDMVLAYTKAGKKINFLDEY